MLPRSRSSRRGAVRSWGDARSELSEKVLGKGGHCDCVEGAPGEERIIQLFGNSERGKVPWLFSVPVGEMQFQLDIKSEKKRRMCAHFCQSNILGISLSCDRIWGTRALVEGVDTARRINIFLEISARSEHGLERRRVTASSVFKGVNRGDTVFESEPDRPSPVFALMYAPSGFQNDCVGVSEENF